MSSFNSKNKNKNISNICNIKSSVNNFNKSFKKINNLFNNNIIENNNNMNTNNNNNNNNNSNIPRTIKVFDNNFHNTIDNNSMNYSFDHLNINTTATNIINNNLDLTYNNNRTYLLQNNYNQSFSSISSSIDALSPPISRAGSPLKFLFDKKNNNYNNNYNIDSGSASVSGTSTTATTPSIDDHLDAFLNCNRLIDSVLSDDNYDYDYDYNSNSNSLNLNNYGYNKFNISSHSIDMLSSEQLYENAITIDNIGLKIINTKINSNSFNYNLNFTSFNSERFKLIKDLSKNESLDEYLVNSILNLFETTNLDLKLELFKKIFQTKEDSFNANTASLNNDWNIGFKSNENLIELVSSLANNVNLNTLVFEFYKLIIGDFIKLLSIVKYMNEIIIGNNHNILDEYHERLNLIQFNREISELQRSSIVELTLSNYNQHQYQYQYDEHNNHSILYLLWKTEKPQFCYELRSLVSN